MASNRILKGILDDFKNKFSLKGDDANIFEHLVNYLGVTKFQPEAFSDSADIEMLNVGGNGTFGLDGIAFVVNGNLVISKNDIVTYAKSNNLDVHIIFTQAKISENIDTGDLLKTIEAIKSFFGDRQLLDNDNDVLNNAFEIYDEICKNAKLINSISPQCHMYFATASNNNNHEFIDKILQNSMKEMEKMYADIKFFDLRVYGFGFIVDSYRELENTINVTLKFKNNISLDRIEGVEQSYIGYLSGNEYLKIITDGCGEIRKKVFYENVRDYQGDDNLVNREINTTLKSKNLRDKFVLLNNGVTIVAKHFKSLGSNEFELSGFQIVNGCQTSHEIYRARECAGDILVPVKIIHTTDSDIVAMVVKSTNRQTPVPSEAFVALEKYHKYLQMTFENYSKNMPLKMYYERRSGELSSLGKSCDEIVTLHSLIRSVTSIYFNDAHVVYNNNPANILHNRYGLLFKEGHPYEIYYVGHYLFTYFSKLCKEYGKDFDGFVYKFRFYIIMVARCLLTGRVDCPDLCSKDAKKETRNLIEVFKNDSQGLHDKMCQAKNIVLNVYSLQKKANQTMMMLLKNSDFNAVVLNQVRKEIENDNKYHEDK